MLAAASWIKGSTKPPTESSLATSARYFDEHDKLRFVEDWCADHRLSLADVAAVGDSRSDLPLFRRAGHSIALNATLDARHAATHVIDTDDLRDVLPLLAR